MWGQIFTVHEGLRGDGAGLGISVLFRQARDIYSRFCKAGELNSCVGELAFRLWDFPFKFFCRVDPF